MLIDAGADLLAFVSFPLSLSYGYVILTVVTSLRRVSSRKMAVLP